MPTLTSTTDDTSGSDTSSTTSNPTLLWISVTGGTCPHCATMIKGLKALKVVVIDEILMRD
jgi:hypothetical protein